MFTERHLFLATAECFASFALWPSPDERQILLQRFSGHHRQRILRELFKSLVNYFLGSVCHLREIFSPPAPEIAGRAAIFSLSATESYL